MTKPAKTHKIKMMEEQLTKKLNRQVVGSLVGCVHCGMCNDCCHYVLSHPDDPKMTPSYKADQLRKLFKANHDWTGSVFPWWVGADKVPLTDEDLDKLKDVAFGTCTNCRRCTINCPMGVDTATLNRIMRGLLTNVGVMPEGVRVVSKDQWELGNQMGVLKEDYLDTIEWMSEELEEDLGHGEAEIPIDKAGAKIMYAINPREVKYDPRTIKEAALIFWAAGEDWTMPSEGWDNTNFGLFSGDDGLGGASAKREYDKARELGVEKIVISECGHGYRSTRCEGVNWSGDAEAFPMESSVMTMIEYIKQGKIVVDPTKNSQRMTFHDSCNNARSCGFFEEPRELLRMVTTDFQEMYPNRAENFCCTGGGGAMSMSEYTPRRLKSAEVKANQIRETGATVVVTSCHNCVDGLSDLIKHYELGCEVKQLVDLVADALVLEECAVMKNRPAGAPMPEPPVIGEPVDEKAAAPAVAAEAPLAGRKILVVDDEEDIRTFLVTVFEDAGAEVAEAADGDECIEMAKTFKPDLISLDLSMPGKSGVDAFFELRKTPEIQEIPVCVVTGHPEFRKVIYDRGVPPPEGYLNKPVDEEKLVSYVAHIIEKTGRESELTLGNRDSTPIGPTAPVSGAVELDGLSAAIRVHGVEANSHQLTDSSMYRRYWDEMPCYLSIHDREFRIIEGNRRFREDFGERIGQHCFKVYKGRDDICPSCPVEATFLDGQNHPSEQLLTTASGGQVPVMVHTTPIRDVSGEVVAVMEMHTEIEEVKVLQKELRQSQGRLLQLFEEVPCFITVQGPDRVIRRANRRFREAFGYGVGEECFRVYKHREEKCLTCPMMSTFETGDTHDYETTVLSKDGEEINLLVTTAPLRNADGVVESVIEMGVDITQIRELQDQLTSIGLLVGSISHGIKGLLTGLDGGIYMVNSGFERDKPERVKKGWEMVQRNVDRIRSMVLDILYYAKDRELIVEDISLPGMVDDLRDGIKKKALDLGADVRFKIPDDIGVFDGDPQAIRAMLLNLIENSIDACRMDSEKTDHVITVGARRAEPYMIISVEDNGIGMDRETRDRIFSLFFSSKGLKGTGLGLFISNKIVDKHGGNIDVESEPGKGTRFVVRIPLVARPSTTVDGEIAGARTAESP